MLLEEEAMPGELITVFVQAAIYLLVKSLAISELR